MRGLRWGFAVLIGMVGVVLCTPVVAEAPRIKRYTARYHVVYTDLPREQVLEAIFRLNAMAETYYQRTKGFSGKVRRKLPFYLHSRYEDYLAALGGRGVEAAGLYTGKELRAAADPDTPC